MSDQELDVLSASLPLRVEGIAVNDPVVTLFGKDWGLNLMCPWTLTGPSSRTDWLSATVETDVSRLQGRALEAVTYSEDLIQDPTFHFEGGLELSVRADTDLDPWTLRVIGLTLVGVQPK